MRTAKEGQHSQKSRVKFKGLRRFFERFSRFWKGFWKLRAKLIAAIALVNLSAASVIFLHLSWLQSQDLASRIERESVLFSRFSLSQVIFEFNNSFYFNFKDRFLPNIRKIIESNENIQRIRILSKRTDTLLFDSTRAEQAHGFAQPGREDRVSLSADALKELETHEFALEKLTLKQEPLLRVVTASRGESGEILFYVEYDFHFRGLKKSIRLIRKQLLVDLIPSFVIGLLVALGFANLILQPVRKLLASMRKVSEGDYSTTLAQTRSDELGELIGAFNAMTLELRKKRELRKYLSDATYRQIMEAPDGVNSGPSMNLGGVRVEAAILFSDIRDFVRHCESLEAEEITGMLNEYFSVMVDVVYKNGGEVDKFMGDGMLAVFYSSPTNPPASACLQSIYCALEMKERLVEWNQKRSAQQKRTVEIGIGITFGELISGPIGAKDRMDFTVIGEGVNLASRIEKLSKESKHTGIVFSDSVEEKIRGLLHYEPLSAGKIRGFEQEVSVFEFVGIRDLNELLQHLSGKDPDLRRRSLEILGQSHNSAALPPVIGALSHLDEETRLRAAISLSKLARADEAQVVEAITSRLELETSARVLASLISSLGKLCTSERILAIEPFLDSRDERIAANAIEAMGLSQLPRAADLILTKLGTKSPRIKANAAMALFAAGRVEVIDFLKPMLVHSDAAMRSSAAFAIGELTLLAERGEWVKRKQVSGERIKFFLAELQECVPMLVSLLRDPEFAVRKQSVLALSKIKDRAATLPLIDMIQSDGRNRQLLPEIAQALRSIGSHRLVRELVARFE